MMARGFTIVELLIVVVVIAVLAAITVVSFNGITKQAQSTKIKTDIATLQKAIMMARENKSLPLKDITGYIYSVGSCIAKPAGTVFKDLPKTDLCWVTYLTVLDRISIASGADVRNLVDPWGQPYVIDENEGEDGVCREDTLQAFQYPYTGARRDVIAIPVGGFC